jgi:hypothetical protein
VHADDSRLNAAVALSRPQLWVRVVDASRRLHVLFIPYSHFLSKIPIAGHFDLRDNHGMHIRRFSTYCVMLVVELVLIGY